MKSKKAARGTKKLRYEAVHKERIEVDVILTHVAAAPIKEIMQSTQ